MEEQLQQRILNTVRSAKRVIASPAPNTPVPMLQRQQSMTPSAHPTQFYQNMTPVQKNFQLTAQYSAYVSTLKQAPANTLLIESIELSSVDPEYHHDIKISTADIANNTYGQQLIIPRRIQQIQLKLNLLKPNLGIQGYLSFQFRPRPDYCQTIMESLPIIDDGCSVKLNGSVSFVEIVVGNENVQQAMVLVLVKQ